MKLFRRKQQDGSNSSSPSGVRGRIDLTAPQNYAEMTEKQVRYVAHLQVNGRNTEKSIWTKCLVKFTGLKAIGGTGESYYFIKKNLKGFFSMSIDDIYDFSERMSFLTRKYEGIRPMAKIGKYRPCDELLRDISFLQYLDAENYYQAYIFTKDEEHLHMLMATLFRIPGKEYNNDLTKRAIKRMSKCSEVEKLIVVMWMVGIKEYFSNKFRYLFNRVEIQEDEPAIAPDMLEIIRNQVRMLTEGDITKENQVLSAQAWSALGEMNDKCREAKEMEARTPNP